MPLARRQLPDLRLLQTFDSAARHGNFTRAAEELSLTQSAVSRQIRELEDQVGKDLFERVRGRVVMTAAGRVLHRDATRLLHLAERTLRQATSHTDVGLIRLNAPGTFAIRWLTPRLPGYLAAHPGISLDLATRPGVFDLQDAGCDLAIHYGHPVWPGATCTYLCSEIVLPVCGGALPALTAQDLALAPKLHVTERPRLWPEWFARHGLDPEAPTAGHWFDQIALTIEAAKAGMGYALLPNYLIEADIKAGDLRVACDASHSTELAYYIVEPEGHPEATADLRAWLLSQVRFRPLAEVTAAAAPQGS